MELRMAFHALTGRRMVEVLDNSGAFVGAIYPDDLNNGIRIVSEYIATFDIDKDLEMPEPLPVLAVRFMRDFER